MWFTVSRLFVLCFLPWLCFHVVDGRERTLLVHRKGSTRAFPPHHPLIPVDYQLTGQPVLIGGTMGTCRYLHVDTTYCTCTVCACLYMKCTCTVVVVIHVLTYCVYIHAYSVLCMYSMCSIAGTIVQSPLLGLFRLVKIRIHLITFCTSRAHVVYL